MFSRKSGKVTPSGDGEPPTLPNQLIYSNTIYDPSPPIITAEDVDPIAPESDLSSQDSANDYSSNQHVVTLNPAGSSKLTLDLGNISKENLMKRPSLGRIPFTCSYELNDGEKLPSAKKVDDTIPQCQAKYDRVFAKPTSEVRSKHTLPSFKRSRFELRRGTGLTGYQAWLVRKKLSWVKCKLQCMDIRYRLELWRDSIKDIEGHFGSGVVAYFQFLKWLFLLNLWIFLIASLFIVLPQLCFSASSYDTWLAVNSSDVHINASAYCSLQYTVSYEEDISTLILDFLQGTGWMEQTVLFYGYYSDMMLRIGTWDTVTHFYSLPLAYILVTGVVFLLSLMLMVRFTAGGFRSRIIESDDSVNRNSNIVFGGWDYSLNDARTAELKQKNLHNEIVADLHEEREAVRRSNRTSRDMARLVAIRIFINLFVIAVLCACGYGIYYATQKSLEFKDRSDYSSMNKFLQLLMEYVPSLTISLLNFIVPLIFTKIAVGEDYSPVREIQVTLGRTVFLRLASLGVLLGTLYSQVTCEHKDDQCNVGIQPDCPILRCWETYVGQQIYKLVVLDFFIVLAKVFLVDFPRRVIVTKCDCKLSKLIGKPEFEIPKEVLDLVYSQILCWLGVFFSPLIPAICVLKSFLVFYLKKLTCIYNYIPPARPYRAARSQIFFMAVLLTAFIMCCVPIGYIIWKLPPSMGCGPFRVYTIIFDVIVCMIAGWPDAARQICSFIASAVFLVPLFILFVLVIYYYHAVASARKEMIRILRDQIVLEGKDKRFLLTRVNQLTGHGPPGYDRGHRARDHSNNNSLQSENSKRLQHTHNVTPSSVTVEDE